MTGVKSEQNFSKLPASFKLPFSTKPELHGLFFYVQTTGIIYTRPDYFLRRDTLDGMLLLSVLKGKGRLIHANFSYPLREGSLFLIDCREYHEIYSDLHEPMVFCFLHFNGPNAREYTRAITEAEHPVFSIEKQDSVLVKMRRIILLLKYHEPAAAILCSGLIHEILTELMLKRGICIQELQQPPEYIRRTQMYISEHYFENLTLEDLAREAAVSKYHFTRLFKQHTGQSAYDFLVSLRLDKAKEMLINTTFPVTQISEECGFNTLTHFSRSFKKKESLSPRTYRKLYKDA